MSKHTCTQHLQVGAAGLMAYVTVYDSLEQAAKTVLTHSADASAQYIQYK